MTATVTPETFGRRIEERIISELALDSIPRFENLLDLKNLKDESTGYIKVLNGERIEKASSLSIDIAPGMRYFNIHIIPDPGYRMPRYLFEGMLTSHGSQVSMDLFPDVDEVMNIDYLKANFDDVRKIYDEARKNEHLQFENSRQMHMRAFASPFFLCIFDTPESTLTELEAIAASYLDEWIKLYSNALAVTPEDAERTRQRRLHMAQTLIAEDPDRQMVVKIYGEDMTRAIEEANML
jgi:hypothetical protein